MLFFSIFFFKQKTAYEMRISDWSSDVCSSDLIYYRNSGMIPASQAGRDDLAREGSDTDRKIIEYVELLQQNPAAPRYPGVTGMSGMLRRANEGVAFGQLPPPQATDQFVAHAGARLGGYGDEYRQESWRE